MSYNLTTNLYKVKSDINIINKRDKNIIFDEHLVMSYEDNFINYYDIDFDDVNIHKLEFEKLKEKYKMIKMVVPFFDFLPVLKNKNINPEDYVRVEIFNCLDILSKLIFSALKVINSICLAVIFINNSYFIN